MIRDCPRDRIARKHRHMTHDFSLAMRVVFLFGVVTVAFAEKPDERLFAAARTGDLAGATAAIRDGAKVDAHDEYAQTPLVPAVHLGRQKIARLLLDGGADVNAVCRCDGENCGGHTVLMAAVLGGDAATVEMLLKAGADARARDSAALALADAMGQANIAAMLEAAGARAKPIRTAVATVKEKKADATTDALAKPRGFGAAAGGNGRAGLRLAIIADEPGASAAEFLTAEFSKSVALVERTEIDRVLAERQLAGFGSDLGAVGRLLSADAVLLVRSRGSENPRTIETRLVTVSAGVVVDTAFAPSEGDPRPWAAATASRVTRLLPKCAVEQGRAVAIGLLNVRASVATPAARAAEDAFNALLAHDLVHVPEVFVLERREMDRLVSESVFSGGKNTSFWGSGWLLDGGFDLPPGKEDGVLALRLRLQSASGGKPVEISMEGTRDHLPELVAEAVRRLRERVGGSAEAAPWDREKEARVFLQEALWAEDCNLYGAAREAAETAWALGLREASLARVRVLACTGEIFHRVIPLGNRRSNTPEFSVACRTFQSPLASDDAVAAEELLALSARGAQAFLEGEKLLRAESAESWIEVARTLFSEGGRPLDLFQTVSAQRTHASALDAARTSLRAACRVAMERADEMGPDAEKPLEFPCKNARLWGGSDRETLEFLRELFAHGRDRPGSRWRMCMHLGVATALLHNRDAEPNAPTRATCQALAAELCEKPGPEDQLAGWMLRYRLARVREDEIVAGDGYIAALREAARLLPADSSIRRDDFVSYVLGFSVYSRDDEAAHPFFQTRRVAGIGLKYALEFEELRAALLKGGAVRERLPISEVRRFWHPFASGVAGLVAERFSLSAESFVFAEGKIWCAGFDTDETRGGWIFTIDPGTFRTESQPVPSEFRGKRLAVGDRWIFLYSEGGKLNRCERRTGQWKSFAGLMPSYASSPMIGDDLFLRILAEGADGLLRFHAPTGETELLISARRNPPAGPLDDPALYIRVLDVTASGELAVATGISRAGPDRHKAGPRKIYDPRTRIWRDPRADEAGLCANDWGAHTHFGQIAYSFPIEKAPDEAVLAIAPHLRSDRRKHPPYSVVHLQCGDAFPWPSWPSTGFWFLPKSAPSPNAPEP